MTAFLFVALALSPDPAPLVAGLGAPRFADRERAERALAARMTWALAVRLERTPAPNAEARRRVALLVERWWAAQYPGPEQCPYIDALNTERLCTPPNVAVVRHYLPRGRTLGVGGAWGEYRGATWCLLGDLRRLRVPPALVRPLLAYMAVRSAAWDRSRKTPGLPSE